jgi:nicotinamidase-related amidase
MKPALIVLDIQNVWLDDSKELKRSVEERLGVINATIGWFRRNKLPIVVVYHEEEKMGLVPGIHAFEVPPSVDVEESDVRVVKRYPNAFGKTGLDAVLRKQGCDTVVIEGLSASGCVLATYFGAMDHDFTPYIVKNGVASNVADHVRFAEEVCDTTSVDSLDKLLG